MITNFRRKKKQDLIQGNTNMFEELNVTQTKNQPMEHLLEGKADITL